MKIYVFILALLFSSINDFQQRSTTGMKIILIVDSESNTVSKVTPLDTFQRMLVSEVHKKYPQCHFYTGSLKGNYTLVDTSVIPAVNATVTMYTEKEFFRFGQYSGATSFNAGDDFSLGKVSSKITSNKKGELNLKVGSK